MRDAMAATGVGTWDLDLAAGLCFCDPSMSMLYGFSIEEGERGVPLVRMNKALHPEDRARGLAKRALKIRTGGLFVNEYRIVPPSGCTRWVLARGLYQPDETGRVTRACGIAIDVTDSKNSGYLIGQGFYQNSEPTQDNATALIRAADYALSTRRAIDELRDDRLSGLRPLIDMLLLEIGRHLHQDSAAGRGK